MEQVGFCTFDSNVHYYNLKASLGQPQMLVVPDHTDPFLPVPDDLLVNLSESRAVVDTLVENLAQASMLVGSDLAIKYDSGFSRLAAYYGELSWVTRNDLNQLNRNLLFHRVHGGCVRFGLCFSHLSLMSIFLVL